MLSGLFTGARAPSTTAIPLFPLRTVLFPGGRLPLKVFEQRYIDMTKACLKQEQPFGVVMITAGDEVATRGGTPSFANFGTLARITGWDMPELGILHVATDITCVQDQLNTSERLMHASAHHAVRIGNQSDEVRRVLAQSLGSSPHRLPSE